MAAINGPFASVLVANRGEIARRVIRTVRRMGMTAIAVYSEADALLPYVREANESVLLGPTPPADSYLASKSIIQAALRMGAEAVHPGYGFLAESADFAQAVSDAGLVWVGPSPYAIATMGDKVNARNFMSDSGVPIAIGTGVPIVDVEKAIAAAKEIGYPLMVKACGGGGGIGMSVAQDEETLRSAFATARDRGNRFFGNPAILLERYMATARHVEIQILGLASGQVVALGERDCSVQRRHQKVAEESPSPAVSDELRGRMIEAAVRAGEVVGYRNAGTVECLVDPETQEFFFLEMNTRLQVEHAVTEMVTGLDLVEQQLLIAAGRSVTFDPACVGTHGHALEMRVYAEDSQRFLPSPGLITTWAEPTGDGVRVDSGYANGDTVTQFYDPLLAKLIVWGENRDGALARARGAVKAFRVEGPKTNLAFFAELLDNDDFVSGRYDTNLIGRMRKK